MVQRAPSKLKVVAHSRDPKFKKSFWGEEYLNTKECTLKGSKLFNSEKRKLDIPPWSKDESPCLDKLKDSITYPNARSMRAHIKESLKLYDNIVVANISSIME